MYIMCKKENRIMYKKMLLRRNHSMWYTNADFIWKGGNRECIHWTRLKR